MNRSCHLGNIVLINGALMVGVAIPHLIDDFLFEVLAEIDLSRIQTQILAGLYAAMLTAVFSLVAMGNRLGCIILEMIC